MAAHVESVRGADGSRRERWVWNHGLSVRRAPRAPQQEREGDQLEPGELGDHAGSPVNTILPSPMVYGPSRLSAPSPSRIGAFSLSPTPASTSCRTRPSTEIVLIVMTEMSCDEPSASVVFIGRIWV